MRAHGQRGQNEYYRLFLAAPFFPNDLNLGEVVCVPAERGKKEGK
jgi:hypothetical protein